MSYAIGLTGTPGTGKKTVAAILERRLNTKTVDLNRLAAGEGPVLNISKLKKSSVKALETKPVIIYGHLLPYTLSRRQLDLAVVLRCDPSILLKRYAQRNYSEEKAKENAGAETLDIALADTVKVFGRGKVAEVDTTHLSPDKVAESILSIMRGEAPRRLGVVNWLTQLNKEGKMRLFFP